MRKFNMANMPRRANACNNQRSGSNAPSAARIAESLAGHPVPSRGGNFLVPCPAHDDDNPSLSLRDGARGLIVHCFSGCEPSAVYTAIRRHGYHLRSGDTAPKPIKGTSEYERRQHEKAAWLWSQRQPIAGSPAECYLREARGYQGALPPTVGFLPARRAHPPALIAALAMPDEPEPGMLATPRLVEVVHITRVLPDGSDRERGDRAKIIIGRPLGRPIILAPPNDLLAIGITEGIEDALTAHAATGVGAWAAGSAAFMPALADRVPGYIEWITIFAHPDQAGERNARKLAAALAERGFDVCIEGLA
jgi:hypothetical protein